ncbi:MAG: PD-(D/E)XK nuclease family protein [Prevotellaceae bacterium]|jgi:hypothetical protein|nr:PD-(D/E)XK nuclease family protein [Prevotellaceae bacterium]
MTTFLDTTAADLYARFGEKISALRLVFPNRRSRLFFTQSLSKIIDKPLWQPHYNTIEEVVSRAAGRQASEPLALLLELYDIYCAVRHSSEPFDHFYFWGEVMLRDFDMIDKYRIDAGMLFRNLKAQKELEGDFSFLSDEQAALIREFWDSFSTGKSGLQERFIATWDALFDIYTQFRQRLREKEMAYEGMLYRDLDLDSLPDEHFVFIGFNALNACEKLLFRHLKKRGRADFYWDYDAYYLHNPKQEAGVFLRQNIADFPSPEFDKAFSPFAGEKDIRMVAASSDAMQTKLVPQLLRDMHAAPDRRTAVVLADETLLIPTLHALPTVAADINVTMGYPLRQTPVYTLLELTLRLHHKAKQRGGATRFYYRDVLALLHHPYLKAMTPQAVQRHANDIVAKNKIYVSPDEFSGDALLSGIFTPAADYRQLVAQLLSLLDAVTRTVFTSENEKMAHACALHCARLLNKLHTSVDESRIALSLPVFTNMLRKLFRHENIPFSGEPLAGIQVLGLLETRNLDFENIIVLSCNEGILPQHSNAPSFIPYNLRRGFGLPTIEQHEAVYAYYFYRLLQRAKKITLVYNTKTDDVRTGEASRYLLQLQMESQKPIVSVGVNFAISHTTPEAIVISKDEKTMQELAAYYADDAPRSLSPSAINAYLACNLQFYYRYIERLKPRDEAAEDIDGKLLGNVLHRAMEALYKPFGGKNVTHADMLAITAHATQLDEAVSRALAGVYYGAGELPREAHDNGKIMLLRDITAKYVRQILHYDAARTPFVIEDTERVIMQRVACPDVPAGIWLGGIIDRLDRQGNALHIVDYKTGATKDEFKNIAALFGDNAGERRKEALQILLYAVLLKQQHPDNNVVPKLYFLRKIYQHDTDFLLTEKDTKQRISEISPYVAPFTGELVRTLSHLFNKAIPFTQTADLDTCHYCDYKKICGRKMVKGE